MNYVGLKKLSLDPFLGQIAQTWGEGKCVAYFFMIALVG